MKSETRILFMKMAITIIAVLAGSISFAEGRVRPSVKPLYTCTGLRSAQEQIALTIERSSFDEMPGIPVNVTVVSNLSLTELVSKAPGRLFGDDETGITVKFNGGSFTAKPGNAGFTGISPNFTGPLTLDGQEEINLRCPQSEE